MVASYNIKTKLLPTILFFDIDVCYFEENNIKTYLLHNKIVVIKNRRLFMNNKLKPAYGNWVTGDRLVPLARRPLAGECLANRHRFAKLLADLKTTPSPKL